MRNVFRDSIAMLAWALAGASLPAMAQQSGQGAAGESIDRDAYRPPSGFNTHSWGTALGEFRRLAPEPVYVRIAHSEGATTEFDMECFLEGSPVSVCSEVEGAGFHAMAEYYVEGQGFRLNDSRRTAKTILSPIAYQFCAQWPGFSYQLQGDVLEKLKLCGVRLVFRSETAAQLRQITNLDYVTAARSIRNWLFDTYGLPEGYERKPSVTIVGLDEPGLTGNKNRPETWYWCSPKVDEMTPSCDASIVYTFDLEAGIGQVLMITAPVWRYAHARRFGGSEDDPLYRLLHGNIRHAAVRRTCTGTFLCDPPAPKAMSEKVLARFRLTPESPSPPKQD